MKKFFYIGECSFQPICKQLFYPGYLFLNYADVSQLDRRRFLRKSSLKVVFEFNDL